MKKKWYTITTVSGKEKNVVESLKNRVISENMQDDFDEFLVTNVPYISPKELEKKRQNLPYKIRERNLYPGYMFVKMNMTNETWFMVRNTQYVTGLVGSFGQRTKPASISDFKIEEIKKKVELYKSDFKSGKLTTPFLPDQVVEIIDGPAKGQVVKILQNDDINQTVQVKVKIIGSEPKLTEIEYKHLRIKK